MVWMVSRVSGLGLWGTFVGMADEIIQYVKEMLEGIYVYWRTGTRKGKLCIVCGTFRDPVPVSQKRCNAFWLRLMLPHAASYVFPQVSASHLFEETKWIFCTITSSMLCFSRVMEK